MPLVIARLFLGLLIAAFHARIDDFILEREEWNYPLLSPERQPAIFTSVWAFRLR